MRRERREVLPPCGGRPTPYTVRCAGSTPHHECLITLNSCTRTVNPNPKLSLSLSLSTLNPNSEPRRKSAANTLMAPGYAEAIVGW